ncbi:hypothetical protein P775_24350 [Puniceibacterium antarcticum]|uniref:Uncharacterized protein n=1 Tax=Puniceibacterium antarcticum TaxID=1206336 RepID=A0A2G8R723_9RHOB|nr:hypothetical protein P775_24350 [Puniceibacterium antarcticum]
MPAAQVTKVTIRQLLPFKNTHSSTVAVQERSGDIAPIPQMHIVRFRNIEGSE